MLLIDKEFLEKLKFKSVYAFLVKTFFGLVRKLMKD